MDVKAIDLNLLVVLDAMLAHRQVTRAGEALGLSQPAMSAAVARLRAVFGDPLFVRAGAEMRPTPRALELAAPVRRVVETVNAEILQGGVFEPATSERSFTLITPDLGEINFVPRLLQRLATEAPRARLRTIARPRAAAAEALESGDGALAVGYFPDLRKSGFFQQKLFDNPYVCIVRPGHPAIGTRLTLPQYLAASHAVVAPDGREHAFEQFMRQRGLARRVVLELSNFMSLLPVLEQSDLIATVPRDMADIGARYAALRVLDVPLKVPAIAVHQYWHRRFHKDPATIWLRGLIQQSLMGTPN